MVAWRVAVALDVFRSQVNAARPNRNRIDDGTIGDEAHQSRTSDHNPWVREGKLGIVTGLDVTHDPARGVDTYAIAEELRMNRDPRVKYVISNGRIFSGVNKPLWEWVKYTGANKHDHHVHVSVRPVKALYDDASPWNFGDLFGHAPETDAPPEHHVPSILRIGAAGADVVWLQKALGLEPDGFFGQATELAVGKFQRRHGLVVDGVVGGYTLRALMGGLISNEEVPRDA